MKRQDIRRNPTGTAVVDVKQRERDNDLSRLLSSFPLLKGELIQGISLPAGGTVTVRHHLQRTPTGYLVTRVQEGRADFFDTKMSGSEIVLSSTVASKIDLWVF